MSYSANTSVIGGSKPVEPFKSGVTWSATNSRVVGRDFRLPLLIFAAHIPLGVVLYQSRSIAAAHAFGTLILGMYFALRRDVRLLSVAMVVGYLIGAEVLWRMAGAEIYWEFGKYAAGLIMVTSLIRRHKWDIPATPSVYLLLLIPSCILTLVDNSIGVARDSISFNMSGPALIFIGGWFFSNLHVKWIQVKKIFIAFTMPVVSVAFISLFFTATLENIEFGTESNFSTSGGFGPNQVSSMLGLAAFISAGLILLFRNRLRDQMLLGTLVLLFAGQSMLTFSRGGMYNAIGALLVVFVVGIRSLSGNITRILPILGTVLLFTFLLFPFLNDFTGGALQARFEDVEATGRLEIVEADYQIYLDNIVLGAGVGEAKDLREVFLGKAVGAHTEFARLIAEHGTLGLLAIVVLLVGIGIRLWKLRSNLFAALAAGCAAWSCLFMMNAGMRLAAPSLLLTLGFTTIRYPTALPRNRRRIASKA